MKIKENVRTKVKLWISLKTEMYWKKYRAQSENKGKYKDKVKLLTSVRTKVQLKLVIMTKLKISVFSNSFEMLA